MGKCRKQALAEACAVCSPRSWVSECYGDFSTIDKYGCGGATPERRSATIGVLKTIYPRLSRREFLTTALSGGGNFCRVFGKVTTDQA